MTGLESRLAPLDLLCAVPDPFLVLVAEEIETARRLQAAGRVADAEAACARAEAAAAGYAPPCRTCLEGCRCRPGAAGCGHYRCWGVTRAGQQDSCAGAVRAAALHRRPPSGPVSGRTGRASTRGS